MTHLLIISGISGSGKSTVAKALEDIGYYCVDNLPSALLPAFIELCIKSSDNISKVALVIDVREGVFFKNLPYEIKSLEKKSYSVELLFLDSSDETLIKRYNETRRKHPLSPCGNIIEAISTERKMLQEINQSADHVIDTSYFNVHQLREIIQDTFGHPNQTKLSLNFLSFGSKYGLTCDADLVFDVRFLPNPHFVEDLKTLTGLDKKVIDFVSESENSQIFIEKIVDLLNFLIPKYEKEGKSYLTVAIGCTGGKHRSVVIANKIFKRFIHLSPNIRHRDIMKG